MDSSSFGNRGEFGETRETQQGVPTLPAAGTASVVTEEIVRNMQNGLREEAGHTAPLAHEMPDLTHAGDVSDLYVIHPRLYGLPSVNQALRHKSLLQRHLLSHVEPTSVADTPRRTRGPRRFVRRNRLLRTETPAHGIEVQHPAVERNLVGRDMWSLYDTMVALAVPMRDGAVSQQENVISAWVEDIALQKTQRLPSTLFAPPISQTISDDQQAKAAAEKRQAVASTAGGAAIAGVGDLVSSILRYVITVLMTNLFAPAVYGTFVEANTVVTVLGYAAKLGLDSVLLRFLANYRSTKQRSLAAGLLRFSVAVALVSGLIWGAVFFFTAPTLADVVFKEAEYVLPFREAALLVPLIGLQLVIAAGLQAAKAIKWKVYVDRLIQPGLTLLLLVVFYKLGLKLEALIFATVIGYLASTMAGYIFLRKANRKIVQEVKPQYDLKTWGRFALPMFFNSMIRNILNSTDVLFLGALAAQSQLAFYGAADRVSYFVVAPLIALNAIFSPVIAEYHARGEHKQLENMFKIVTKWSFSLSWPVFLCFLVYHEAILGVFGKAYTEAGLVLILLSLGNLVDAGVGSVNYLLVMTGRPRIILINTVTTVVVNVSLALLFIPHLGIIGAALAAALTVIILNIVGLIEVFIFMKMHPYRWDMFKPIIAGIGAALVGFGLTHLVHTDYGHEAFFHVLALIIPFLIVYAALLAVFRFSEEDIIVFNTIRARFTRRKVS